MSHVWTGTTQAQAQEKGTRPFFLRRPGSHVAYACACGVFFLLIWIIEQMSVAWAWDLIVLCVLFFRVIVRLDSWPVSSMYPNGHFVRSLGPIGELETEISALMVENSLTAPRFTEAQLKELPHKSPGEPWAMPQEEVLRRRDIRCDDIPYTQADRLGETDERIYVPYVEDTDHFML